MNSYAMYSELKCQARQTRVWRLSVRLRDDDPALMYALAREERLNDALRGLERRIARMNLGA